MKVGEGRRGSRVLMSSAAFSVASFFMTFSTES